MHCVDLLIVVGFQKKSLEFKDTLMVQLKADLTASEVRADALDHQVVDQPSARAHYTQVDSMERKLRHAEEQLVAERQMAAHQLEERTAMLDQAHQLEIDALNGCCCCCWRGLMGGRLQCSGE